MAYMAAHIRWHSTYHCNSFAKLPCCRLVDRCRSYQEEVKRGKPRYYMIRERGDQGESWILRDQGESGIHDQGEGGSSPNKLPYLVSCQYQTGQPWWWEVS